jgi:hypothetical protein
LAEAWLDARFTVTWSAFHRFLVAPATDLASRSGDGLAAGDDRVGRAASSAGRLAAATSRAPAVPLAILFAVLLALVLGLIAPGVFR